ncbi:hypothetical protein TPAR_07349 [Tolypocladium paradoxum]|uniref:Uncharacterized protein n=1 Tax=Tolypocladium paradoxum TaxID=94208 RepID=A0A2S4KQG6_9HYPO|nr:hypothetical protein TPAR_07349 [Tolypocladium paradoxum]
MSMDALAAGPAHGPDVDGHALEGGVKQRVAVEKARDAGLALARQQLQKGRQVLGAHHLVRQDAVEQAGVGQGGVGVVALGLEAHDGADGARAIDEVERGAEEPGQRIGQRQPVPVGLVVRLRIEPGPELDAGAALARAAPGPRAPLLGVPAAQREAQVQLARAGVLQDLAQRPREQPEVVRLEVGERRVGPEVEAGEEGREWQGPQGELLVVVGGGGGEEAWGEREEEQHQYLAHRDEENERR